MFAARARSLAARLIHRLISSSFQKPSDGSRSSSRTAATISPSVIHSHPLYDPLAGKSEVIGHALHDFSYPLLPSLLSLLLFLFELLEDFIEAFPTIFHKSL